MRLLSLIVLVFGLGLTAPNADACYHDSTIREQEQEFESGYDPVVQPPVEEVEEPLPPEGIVYEEQQTAPQFHAAGLGGIGLGLLILGNVVLIARRKS